MLIEVHPITGRHRWRCGCGRLGVWLDDERAARRNAVLHAACCGVVL